MLSIALRKNKRTHRIKCSYTSKKSARFHSSSRNTHEAMRFGRLNECVEKTKHSALVETNERKKTNLTFVIIVFFVFSYIKSLVSWMVRLLLLLLSSFIIFVRREKAELHSICFKIYIYVRAYFSFRLLVYVVFVRFYMFGCSCVSQFFLLAGVRVA